MSEGKESVVILEPEKNKNLNLPKFLTDSAVDAANNLEKMYQNLVFYQGEKEEDYTVEGSIISCKYGYTKTRISIMKDHAIYDNNGNAVLTCGDCMANSNIYNFGLCSSPFLDKNSEKTIIERGVPFAVGEKISGYKCKMLLAPAWQTGKVHTHIWNADKNKYEAVLPKDGMLTCMYGAGTIKIEEVNKEKKEPIADLYYVWDKVKVRKTPNGEQYQEMVNNKLQGRAFTEGAILKVLSKDIEIVEGSDEEWIKIEYDITKEGWVAKRFLKELPKPITGYKYQYKWEKSSKVTQDFKDKVAGISKSLGIDPDHLMAVMAWESRFDPQIQSSVSTATGLVQFLEATAHELNTTTAALKSMTGLEQLDYVFGYYYPYSGRLKTLGDVYIRVFQPTAIGKNGSEVVCSKGNNNGYEQNAPLDTDGNGKITKDEAVAPVINRRDTEYK